MKHEKFSWMKYIKEKISVSNYFSDVVLNFHFKCVRANIKWQSQIID